MRFSSRTFQALLILLTISTLLASCTAASQKSPVVPATNAVPGAAVPGAATPDATTASGYPASGQPTASQPTAVEVTQDLQLGMVTGTMQLQGKPVRGVLLGLANVLKDANGTEIATSYDPVGGPQTTTRQDGSFTFNNVKPGRYGLIYANLPETYLLLVPGNPKIQQAILVTVTAGQQSDLGLLNFEQLPEPVQ